MLKQLLPALLLPLCFSVSAQTTYYVDASRPDNSGAGTSWATAKRDLQIAVNTAAANDQVWIKAGTYLPTHDPFGSTSPANNQDKTFTLKEGVKVYGGFAGTETQLSQRNWQTNSTILSGDLGTVNVVSDNAYHVVLSVNLTAATLLDGVTITKGNAAAPSGSNITVATRVIDRFNGGGIFNTNSSTTFGNCIVKSNNANCTNGGVDAFGAGVMNTTCNSAFTNCTFDGNFLGSTSFGYAGAGMNISGGSCSLVNCIFTNNTGATGSFIGSRGGALNLTNTTTVITNCVFYANSAENGAAISGGGAGNIPVVTNCTFANNTSSFSGTGFSGFSRGSFRNCIFWNKEPTVNPVAGRHEIVSSETTPANQPTFINCIVREASGNPLVVPNAIMTNCINSNPLFINFDDGDGADNLFGTADDGLRLQCGSPAIASGSGTTPATDFLGLPRASIMSIGAYEGGHGSAALNAIPSSYTMVQLAQNATGVTHYSNCTNKLLEIQSGGAYNLSGSVTAKVWVETSQHPAFVKRHYEITPQSNAATATGRITLYFTQQELNDFNTLNAVKLPVSASDAAGIANIRIEKKAGTSSNGTGHPNSYSGASQTISGSALAVAWNAAAARWEISFDVTGFSGFFLKTQSTPLPLQLISFSGSSKAGCNELQWQTVNERNTKAFEIEHSKDGVSFKNTGSKPAAGQGNNFYTYPDCDAVEGKTFYRLKMTDNDGGFAYSTVIAVERNAAATAKVYPNPAGAYLVIAANPDLLHQAFTVIDAAGRVVIRSKPDRFPYHLSISALPAGTYYLRFTDGVASSFVKR